MIGRSILTAFAILVLYQLALPHLSHRFFNINGQQLEILRNWRGPEKAV